MKELILKVADYLEKTDTKQVAQTLRDVFYGELVNVKETFELGRSLQSIYEREIETSQTGFDEDEIGEVIQFVQDNMKQAKY